MLPIVSTLASAATATPAPMIDSVMSAFPKIHLPKSFSVI